MNYYMLSSGLLLNSGVWNLVSIKFRYFPFFFFWFSILRLIYLYLNFRSILWPKNIWKVQFEFQICDRFLDHKSQNLQPVTKLVANIFVTKVYAIDKNRSQTVFVTKLSHFPTKKSVIRQFSCSDHGHINNIGNISGINNNRSEWLYNEDIQASGGWRG